MPWGVGIVFWVRLLFIVAASEEVVRCLALPVMACG